MMVCEGWDKLADNDNIQIAEINTLTLQFVTKLFNPKIKKPKSGRVILSLSPEVIKP